MDARLHWHHKDLEKDKIPGISLEKFYQENKKTPKASIIVAVLDSYMDSTHPSLKNQIWTNINEISNNGIDDDNNGYIDDINGWSFIGDRFGGYMVWQNHESVRIIRNFETKLLSKGFDTLKNKENYKFIEYKKAKINFDYLTNYYLQERKNIVFFEENYDLINDFSKKNNFQDFSIEKLDSVFDNLNDKKVLELNDRIKNKEKDNSSLLKYLIYFKYYEIKNKNELKKYTIEFDSIINKSFNINFKERENIGDNIEKLEKGYGNNIINNTKPNHYPNINHATMVSGIIAGNRKNNKEVFGFSDQIKIMPIPMSSKGDENDKDIAMAIYYAVDNGAKIINMSFGKDFSVNKQWVTEAIQYAEKRDVLIVKSASNNATNNDEEENYPNDYNYETQEEIAQNMIVVGATTQKADSTLVASYSNYGKKNVDIFAPGENIYTATYKDAYTTDGGTSLAAPMVSGTAALLWLHYPKLTVQEVKQIILESGTSLDLEVIKPGTEEKVPFSSLSKSGKLLNVYNAMKMARKY